MPGRPREAVAAGAREHRLPYPVALADDAAVHAYGVVANPTHVLLDRAGRVLFRAEGFSEAAMAEERTQVEDALALGRDR